MDILMEFTKLCREHDLTYAMSDDHRVWQRGEEQRKRMLQFMREHNIPGKEAAAIFNRIHGQAPGEPFYRDASFFTEVR